MSAASTVFRFVTVRPPCTPTDEELETGFIFYDAKLEAPLVGHLTNARQQKESRRTMRAAAGEFVRSKRYLKTPGDVRKHAGKLLELGQWLARHHLHLTADDLGKELKAYGKALAADAEGLLWENLIAYTLLGGISETREAIVATLRAQNLLKADSKNTSDWAVRRYAMATVVLPAAALSNREHTEREEKKRSPEQEEEDSRRAADERLKSYREARSELEGLYRGEIDRQRDESKSRVITPNVRSCDRAKAGGLDQRPARDAPPESSLDERVLANASAAVRRTLQNLRIPAATRIPAAIKQLDERMAAENRARLAKGAAHRSVVFAGGSLWARRAPTDGHTHKRMPNADQGRTDVEYSAMYEEEQCRIKPLGIADFRRIEQEIWCYEPGEVAHIENVLMGETRDRTTRFLRRSENVYTTETEEETIKERDTQTTDRFELEREIEKTIKEDMSFELGVKIAGKFGVVDIQTNTNFALSQSTSESDRSASKYAKEVVDKASEKLTQRKREERVQKMLEEFEETNKHAFINGTNSPIVGLYRWVDKIYLAKVVNYDKRLMLEFIVPEPAAFHLHAMAEAPVSSTLTLQLPIDPRTEDTVASFSLDPIKSHLDIDETNYAAYAAAYDAKVEPVPPLTVRVSKGYNRDGMDHDKEFSDSKTDLKVPAGYGAVFFSCRYGMHAENHDGGPNWISVIVGQESAFTYEGNYFSGILTGTDEIVPVVVMGRTRMYGLAVEVAALRNPETYEQWQIKTYEAILAGYQNKVTAYQTALAEARTRAESRIRGTNPLLNRQIERTELKNGCIRLMDLNCDPLASEAMKEDMDCHYPEFNCCEAIEDGREIQFVEQAFEWSLMTYLFYPYFWGRKCNWTNIYQIEEPDPLFLGFLQAGYARVVVPVREGYGEAVMRYLADNAPWNGGSVPGVDSELYLSIVNELMQSVGTVDPSVRPWEVRIPTTLTVLQCESGCVPGNGLPCRRDQAQPAPNV
jgi:hypothetical protein